MENFYYFLSNENSSNETSSNDISKKEKDFKLYFGILSIISTIPNLISLFIILFWNKKKNLQHIIQLLLCFSFIGIEIRFYPIILDKKNNYKYMYITSFSFLIISSYYQFIHSFIAYKLFTSPEDLSKFCSKFFIYVFPIILFCALFFIFFQNFENINYTDFNSYLINSDNKADSFYRILKIIIVVIRVFFFLLNILYIILLERNIKNLIKMTIAIDIQFANKKYNIYKRKLKLYIGGMLFVLHPYLLRYIWKYFDDNKDPLKDDYIFSYYYHGIESISALIFWLTYIFNRNLMRRFLIMFCCKKESDYLNEFIEEKKIYEESVKTILTSNENQSYNLSLLNTSSNLGENKKNNSKNEIIDIITDSLEDETL